MVKGVDNVNNVTEEVQNTVWNSARNMLSGASVPAVWVMNRPFHGRVEQVTWMIFFSRAQRLVQEVHRILNDRGPSERDVHGVLH